MPQVARRHHFLPQGYLAGFTDSGRKDGLLNVLDIKAHTSFRTTPLNVAVEKDFKRIDIEGRQPDAVESALSAVEGRAIEAIRSVIETKRFPSDSDFNLLLNLLSLVIAQNPKSRRALNSSRTRDVDAKLRGLVSSQQTWEQLVAAARSADEELKGDLSYERAQEFVEDRRYRIEFDNVGTMIAEFEVQDELLNALAKRKWSVLVAPDHGPHFITSDYPFSLTMEHGYHGTPGFLVSNTELFFPLSKTLGFIGVLGTPLQPVLAVQAQVVAMMNRRILRQADQRLFSSNSSFVTLGREGIIEHHVPPR